MNTNLFTRYWRIFLACLISPLILFLFGAIALYIPWIQDRAVDYLTVRASEQLDMQVKLDRLRLSFPANLSLEGLHLIPHDVDTLLSVEHLELGLSIRPLLSNNIIIPKAKIQGITFNYSDSLRLNKTQLALEVAIVEGLHIDMEQQIANIGLLYTESGRVLYSSIDTLSSSSNEPVRWRINANQIRLSKSSVEVAMPLDSVYISTRAKLLDLQKSSIDLESMALSLGYAYFDAEHLKYALDTVEAPTSYLDPTHISLSDATLRLSDLSYEGTDLKLQIDEAKFKERSGLVLTQLSGGYSMDSIAFNLSELSLQTTHSTLFGDVHVPWALIDQDEKAEFYTTLDGALGAEDVRILTGHRLLAVSSMANYEDLLAKAQTTGAIDFALHTRGSLDSLWIEQAQVVWNGVLEVSAKGSLTKVNTPTNRRGNLTVEGRLQEQASSLIALASSDLARQYSLPDGLAFKGNIGFGSGKDLIDLKILHGGGSVDLNGYYSEPTQNYEFSSKVDRLNLGNFIRNTQLGTLSLEAKLSGHGLDWRSKRTYGEAKVRLNSLVYRDKHLEGITLDGSLRSGAMSLAVNSFNPGLNMAIQLDGLVSEKSIYSNILIDNQEIDLAQWGLSNLPLSIRGRFTSELYSDFDQTYKLDAKAEDIFLSFGDKQIAPKQIKFELATSSQYSKLNLSSGDLVLSGCIQTGPNELVLRSDKLASLAERIIAQAKGLEPMTIHLEDLLLDMPKAELTFEMGADNALRPYLAEQRIAIGKLASKIEISAERGLNGNFIAEDLRQDTLRLKSININLATQNIPRLSEPINLERKHIQRKLSTDSMVLNLSYKAVRTPYRGAEGFTLMGSVRSSLQEAIADMMWLDDDGRSRHQFALGTVWNGERCIIRIPQDEITLAYQHLTVNEDNSISIHKRTFGVDSRLTLAGKNKAMLSLQAESSNQPMSQNAELLVRDLLLEDFNALGLPNIGGRIFADLRYSRSGGLEEQPIITGDVSAQELRYEDKSLGHLASAFFYEPRSDHSHYITAEMNYRGSQALSLDAIYYPDRAISSLEGNIIMNGLPLEIANPFLKDYTTSLSGRVAGDLVLSGSPSKPKFVGNIRGEQALVNLEQYATTLELDSLPLRLEDNAIYFDRYALRSRANRDNPLYIDGKVDVLGEGVRHANLRLKADDILLLNQSNPRSERELVYGKLIASTDMTLRGPLDALKIRGNLSIQGGTNCIYIMREGGLESTDRMNDLLSFVDFADTLFVQPPASATSLGGLDVNIGLHFDPSVRFGVDLTANGTDYMRIQGGGDMQFSYPPYGEMKLIGRYNMNGGGKLHYTIPVVGGKLFEIDPSGYLRFTGDVTNPYINFLATQKVKANVGKETRKTNFLVSIQAKDHVDDIKLLFDLSAPEDLSVQNSLSTMTPEERGKQAIGLMATGIYLAGGGSAANLSFDSALSSLLQSQINKAAGSLLRGTDINIGMEMHDGTSGGIYTDYTYSFSRRFYNDRIRVVVGGKIQSGNVPSNQEQTLIDNVALEYQLDKAGEQYLRLYHKRITDNVLEGEHTETGLGYLIKRKLNRPSDLFRFRFYRPRPAVEANEKPKPWQGVPFVTPSDTTATLRKKEDAQ